MKKLGTLLCKFLTYWLCSKEEREQEMTRCLSCLAYPPEAKKDERKC